MVNDIAIQVENLQKTYRDGLLRRRFLAALKGVSFEVQRGEIFGLLGPNGAGKTTFIKILLGIVRKSGGEAKLLDWPAGNRLARRYVGYLPEDLLIPRHHSGASALEYYGQLNGLSLRQIRARRDEILETVGLAGRERDPVKKYSKGMLQRLGLGQALLHNPDLLILDEPTDGLDPVGRSQVRSILTRLKAAGKTIFLNSHLLQEVELVCDRVAILEKGELLHVGSVKDLAVRKIEGIELNLEIQGSPDASTAAIGNREIIHSEALEDGHYQLRLRFNDQCEVDACIDDLRRHNVSILSLERHRTTLEDAFLDIVTRTNETT
jgi:ABC-2 type transport system ATP-binding protein